MISGLFLNPLIVLLSVLAFLYVTNLRYKKQLSRGVYVLLFLFSLSPVPRHLISILEFSFPPQPQISDSLASYHIIALGAGKNDDMRLEANQRLAGNALARLVEGVKWAGRLPNAILIGSGPKGRYGEVSQAQLMKQTAEMFGVKAERVFVQGEVVNTASEARVYVETFGTQSPVIICTSALHMPRAVKWFTYYGVEEVYAAPAYYVAPEEPLRWGHFVPSLKSFELWQRYFKERLGGMEAVMRVQGSRGGSYSLRS